MKRGPAISLALIAVWTLTAQCGETSPLKLVARYEFPSDVKGRFEHLIVDVQGQRLFTAPVENKAIFVFDLTKGTVVHIIQQIGRPHALFYRQDLHRLFVTDGDAGELKIFNANNYQLVKKVKLLLGADAICYDPATKRLYVVNGGGEYKTTYTMISVIDTTSGTKVDDIRVDREGDTLEGLALERSSPRLYVNNRTKNQVEVIDRYTHRILASWPITLGKTNDPIALDEPNHRLFVACRSGQIVVFDTSTGKELLALPIGGWPDDLVFDPTSKRLYAPSGVAGEVDVYQQLDSDHYRSIGRVPSGPWGKTGRLVPELGRYFVPVPQNGNKNAEVLVYQVQQ